MHAKVKFGCLRDRQTSNAGYHPSSNVVRVVDQYQCERLGFDLPDKGVTRSDLACPICAQSVTLRLTSPAVVVTMVRWALFLCGGLVVAVAVGLHFGPATGSPILETVALGAGGLGFAVMIAAALADQFPTSWVKDSMIAISNDEVRNHSQAGFPGARGHKLLDIDVS